MSSKKQEVPAEEEATPVEETPAEEVPAEKSAEELLQEELAAEKDKHLRLAAEYENFRRRSAKLGELNGYTEEMLSGQKTIRAYGKVVGLD